MSNKIKITESQATVMKLAVKTEGRLERFPENINGGARAKVLRALVASGLAENKDDALWLTDAGYAAIGKKRPEGKPAPTKIAEPAKTPKKVKKGDAAIADRVSNRVAKAVQANAPRSRENSKQAQVIAMLKREEGATIAQICAVTGWQAHTVRGTFAGAFKKKLGMNVTSAKLDGGERVYRITEAGSDQ